MKKITKTNKNTKKPVTLNPASCWPPPPLTADELAHYWQEGAILHVDSGYLTSKIIKAVLSRWQFKIMKRAGLKQPFVYHCLASHDAICVSRDGVDGVGEMSADKARGIWTPLKDYMDKINKGKAKCWLFYPVFASNDDGIEASNNWWRYGQDKPYDYFGLVKLLHKALLFELFPRRAVGWEWAHWCTENVNKCWFDVCNFYHKVNPTPLTTEHRAGWLWSRKKQITLGGLP